MSNKERKKNNALFVHALCVSFYFFSVSKTGCKCQIWANERRHFSFYSTTRRLFSSTKISHSLIHVRFWLFVIRLFTTQIWFVVELKQWTMQCHHSKMDKFLKQWGTFRSNKHIRWLNSRRVGTAHRFLCLTVALVRIHIDAKRSCTCETFYQRRKRNDVTPYFFRFFSFLSFFVSAIR